MGKFKQGDKVYYPVISNRVLTLRLNERVDYPFWVVERTNNFTKTGRICVGDLNPSIFQATPENKAVLEKIYNMEFESP